MEDLLKDIIREINKKCIDATISDNNGIAFKIKVDELIIKLECNLTKTFPYEFPKVYVREICGVKNFKLPHMYTDKTLCIFDETKAIPNFLNPKQLILDTIDKAISILESGTRGENQMDFLDEFNEYWSTKAILKANSFIDNITICKKIYYYIPDKGKIIIADNKDKLINICRKCYYNNFDEKYINIGIIIPIDKSVNTEIPKNDVDIVKMISNNSSNFNEYNRFMQDNINKNVLILFTQIVSTGNILSGWIHYGPGVPNGFRRGHVDLVVAFYKLHKQGIAVSVEDCSQSRLFRRGGDGLPIIINKSAVIGCGSIGSIITDSLFSTGTSDFILNDNQILKYENIGRHTRGYWMEGWFKVEALRFGLIERNPNINCECFTDNAHVFMENNIDKLNSCDIIFVAVATFSVEWHICELINRGKIKVPVVIIWVEPYAVGGHAIVIKGRQNLFEELFDKETFKFQYPIVLNTSYMMKREAGCQSTYIPYSGFYLQLFVLSVIEKVTSETLNKNGNYLLTWYGRVKNNNKINLQISNLESKYDYFTIHEKRVD